MKFRKPNNIKIGQIWEMKFFGESYHANWTIVKKLSVISEYGRGSKYSISVERFDVGDKKPYLSHCYTKDLTGREKNWIPKLIKNV